MGGMARWGIWMLEVERMRPAVPVDGLELWPRCECDMAGELLCEEELSSETFSELLPSLRRRMERAADDLLRL